MAELSYGRVAAISVLAGAGVAVGIMAVIAARAAWTVTRGQRWYQLKAL